MFSIYLILLKLFAKIFYFLLSAFFSSNQRGIIPHLMRDYSTARELFLDVKVNSYWDVIPSCIQSISFGKEEDPQVH